MILVCFAVKQEAGPYLKRARGWPHIAPLITGMGRMFAERGISSALESSNIDLVLSCGFAGALNTGLRSGEVLYQADDNFPLLAKLNGAGVRQGTFYCAPNVLNTAVEKSQAWQRTRADAVEMESQWIRSICKSKGVPGATLRVVLDPADMDLPLDFNSIMDADQRIQPGKLTRAILKDPGLLLKLLRLGRLSSRAAQSLAEVLWKVTAV